MKSAIIFHLLIIFFLFSRSANAELTLVAEKQESSFTTHVEYGYVMGRGGRQYWIRPRLEKDSSFIDFFDFTATGFKKWHSVSIPYVPWLLTSKSNSGALNPLVLGVDGSMVLQATKFSKDVSRLEKSVALIKNMIVNDTAASETTYYVVGRTVGNKPVILSLSADLNSQKEILIDSKRKGEISSIFFLKNRVIAIANYPDAKIELLEITPNGVANMLMELAGSAATGISLRNNNIVVTYSRSGTIYVEMISADFESKWTTKLHAHDSVATERDQIVELPNGIAFVGGVEDRLMVVRLSNAGKILQTSVDQQHNFSIPARDRYLSVVRNNEIHIRGQSTRKGVKMDGSFTSFHFVESEDK